jgi:hypothetical protein
MARVSLCSSCSDAAGFVTDTPLAVEGVFLAA